MGSLLSIVVPVYNGSAFLPRCLESLIGQTYRDIEIICVDDGSSDDSLEVLRQYADQDSRIKVIHQENAGVSAARNRGLDVATGEYVTFVDADDWVEQWGYESVVLDFASEVDIVCYGSVLEGEMTQEFRTECEKFLSIPVCADFSATQFCQKPVNACIWNKMWRRRVIEAHHVRFPEGLKYSEDECFFYCSLAGINKIRYVKDAIYHYVQHAGSAMNAARSHGERWAMDVIRGARHTLHFYQKTRTYHAMKENFVQRFQQCCLRASLEITEPALMASILKQEYQILSRGGLKSRTEIAVIREILRKTQNWFSRVFCQYLDNRICYGVGAVHLLSITYEGNKRIMRVAGRKIKEWEAGNEG